MEKIIKTMLASTLMMWAAGASAQEEIIVQNKQDNTIVLVDIDEAGDEIISLMYATRLPHVHDPEPPRFVLTDRLGNFALGIGGYVRTVAAYDLGGIVDDVDFVPALIPNSSKTNSQFRLDATTANLFVKLVGHSDLLGTFVVHTEGNFRGAGRTFELRNAYVAFRHLTVGYTYGGFMDAAAMPATIDFQGPNGAAFYRTTQVGYTLRTPAGFSLGATVEMPDVESKTENALFDVSHQRMPDFTAFAQYAWDDKSHIRLGGLVRSMSYTSAVRDGVSEQTGYGVQASATANVAQKWQLFGQFTYGKGIARYLNDLGELSVDLVTNPEKDGYLQTLPMMGWYAGVQYNICPALSASAAYSASRLYSEKGYASVAPEGYHYGQYVVANLLCRMTGNMQVGLEYLRGWRTDFDHSTRHANRINLMAKYSF